MRILTTAAVLAGAFVAASLGPLAPAAFAADLDYDAPPPPPPPYYEPRPVPPAFVPYRVPPVVVRPVVYPRVVRPYGFYGPRPVVRVYREPRPYGEGPYVEGRPLPPRAYGEPGYERDRTIVRRDREELGRDGYREGFGREGFGREGFGREGRGYEREHESYRHEREGDRYGHYLNREELERRAEREHGGYAGHDRFAERGGFGRDDRFADRGPGRDFDR